MKIIKLIILYFTSFSGISQGLENTNGHYHFLASKFEYGINKDDSTTTWLDSTLSTSTVIDIFEDSLIYNPGNGAEIFHFLTQLPTNHVTIKSFKSINKLTKEYFVISFFTSDFDEKMMTVIIDTPKISRNFYGTFELD